jgi:3D (Asp-Asp-Asp) domain-containing protein
MFRYRVISRSHWSKAVALCVAVAGFVLLYETRMLDSQATKWMFGDKGTTGPGSRLQFAATAYCKGTTTASGVRVRTGVAAADPALLPVGSVVNVTTGDAKYNGVYTVMDTGPEVKGRELDLYIWSCHEALRFGRKPVQVTVLRLGWDPTASSPTLVDRLFRRREATRRVPAPAPPPPAGMAPSDENVTSPVAVDDDATPAEQPAVSDPAVVATTGL